MAGFIRSPVIFAGEWNRGNFLSEKSTERPPAVFYVKFQESFLGSNPPHNLVVVAEQLPSIGRKVALPQILMILVAERAHGIPIGDRPLPGVP